MLSLSGLFDKIQNPLLLGEDIRRSLTSYVLGFSGLFFSNTMKGEGMPPKEIVTEEVPQWLLNVAPTYVADGTITVASGKIMILGLALSDILSIALTFFSVVVLLIQATSNIQVWLYRRKLQKQLETLSKDAKNKT
jgi:hypothetical protein